MATKLRAWISPPMRKRRPKTLPRRKSRTAGFIDALSARQLRLFQKRPVDFHPIAVVKDLISAGNFTENPHRRVRQVHTEERRVRGRCLKRVADHGSLRQFHGLEGGT